MAKSIPIVEMVRSYVKEHPGCSLEEMKNNIRATEKSLKVALHNTTYKGELLKDDDERFWPNPNHKKMKKGQSKPEQSKNSEVTVITGSGMPELNTDSLPSHVNIALQSLEKLAVDTQICREALKQIKDAADKALNHLAES